MFRTAGLVRKVVANNGIRSFAAAQGLKAAAVVYSSDSTSQVRVL
jgi:hypothetical protein